MAFLSMIIWLKSYFKKVFGLYLHMDFYMDRENSIK